MKPLAELQALAETPDASTGYGYAIETYLNGLTPSEAYLEGARLWWASEPWKRIDMAGVTWETIMQGYENLKQLDGEHERV